MKDDEMNTSIYPDRAMILAAGLGTRMRPITDKTPKPLVKVAGKAMIDYSLDALKASGVKEVVVNVHHLAEQMIDHLEKRYPGYVKISDERAELLDSGGGVKKALQLLGDEPFFLVNGDSFWLEGFKPNFRQLADLWNAEEMDILLLLSGLNNSVGYEGNGDFEMDSEGRLHRRSERKIAPFAYAGAGIINPRLFNDTPDGPFSLNLLFDRAIAENRLFGTRMYGLWLHVGTPEAISQAENAIARSAA